MSKTTNQPDQDTTTGSSHQDVYRLKVAAAVTIVAQSGTEVPAPNIARAIQTLRNHHHDDMPLLALHSQHAGDPLFAGSAPGWLLSSTQILEIGRGTELTREPDYWLLYRDFKLSDPQVDGAPKTPCNPDVLVAVATKAAEASGQPVQLESKLLGFANPVFNPDDGKAAEAEEAASLSVLDVLAPSLFTTGKDEPILVQPPEPVRTGNIVTVPEATGVEYNVDPGDYPIEGEGVSINATPAPGYVFPDDAPSMAWDYEFHEGEPTNLTEEAVDEETAVDELDALVGQQAEEAEPAAPKKPFPAAKAKTAIASLTSVMPRRKTEKADTPATEAELSTSTELVVAGTTASTPWWRRRATVVSAAAGTVAAVVAGVLIVSGTEPGEDAPAQPEWLSTVEPPTVADQPLTEDLTTSLWDMDPEVAEEVSWTGAGVAHIDPEDDSLALVSTLSGDGIGRVQLEEPVEWTAEFVSGDEEAIGARTENQFVAITSDGQTQRWEIDEEATLRTSGSTPMLIDDGEIYALVVGEDDPVSVTANPEYHPAAIDGETLIQYASGAPRVVTVPITDDASHEAAELVLEDPAEGASFQRHLTFGHGLSLSEWQIDGSSYLVVHDLQDDASVSAVVPSFDGAESWTVGRGMELATIGGYAFDLDDGSLVAETDDAEFGLSMGPVAVIETENGREFVLEGEQYTETTRVIGYTGAGTAIVREPDGSIAAVSESSGMA